MTWLSSWRAVMYSMIIKKVTYSVELPKCSHLNLKIYSIVIILHKICKLFIGKYSASSFRY